MTVRFGRYLRHKFNAVPVTDNEAGMFDSKKEYAYFQQLKMRQKPGGDILFFLRQVPIALPGKTKYVCDFLEFHNDGSVHFVDAKGMKTDMYNLKKRQVEEIYPFCIEEV